MTPPNAQLDEAKLRTVWQQRQIRNSIRPLGATLTSLMNRTLARRVRQLGKLADIWQQLVPPEIAEHTALEGFSRGVLRVTVDTASHRFQLQSLLSSGLQREIQQRFAGPLNKIRLTPGQFSSIDEGGNKRYAFLPAGSR